MGHLVVKDINANRWYHSIFCDVCYAETSPPPNTLSFPYRRTTKSEELYLFLKGIDFTEWDVWSFEENLKIEEQDTKEQCKEDTH